MQTVRRFKSKEPPTSPQNRKPPQGTLSIACLSSEALAAGGFNPLPSAERKNYEHLQNSAVAPESSFLLRVLCLSRDCGDALCGKQSSFPPEPPAISTFQPSSLQKPPPFQHSANHHPKTSRHFNFSTHKIFSTRQTAPLRPTQNPLPPCDLCVLLRLFLSSDRALHSASPSFPPSLANLYTPFSPPAPFPFFCPTFF
jgi:hypothetical protein